MALVSKLRLGGDGLTLTLNGKTLGRLLVRKTTAQRAEVVLIDLHPAISVTHEAAPVPSQEPPPPCPSSI